jgi:hypothetical protein
VADYFDMLDAELLVKAYTKSLHRKALIPRLSGRSEGSIEFKHQNVSGVLVELGLPYIEGHKPRSNYPSILATAIEAFLDQRPSFLQRLASAPNLNPTHPKPVENPSLEEVIEDPSEKVVTTTATAKPWLTRRARRIDFAELDAANRPRRQAGRRVRL